MAKYVLKDPKIVFAGSTITSSCASVTINLEADDVETTAFGSEWRTRLGGLKSGTVDFEMHADFGAGGIDSLFFPNLGGTVAVSVQPAGTALSSTSPAYNFDVLVTEYSPVDGAVGDLATTSVSLPITGPVTRATA